MLCAARSSARTSLNPPPRLPMGVRTPPTMYASAMFVFRPVNRAPEDRHEKIVLVAHGDPVVTQSVGEALLFGRRGQHVAHVHWMRIRDGVLDGNGDVPVRVRRECKRAIGEGI